MRVRVRTTAACSVKPEGADGAGEKRGRAIGSMKTAKIRRGAFLNS